MNPSPLRLEWKEPVFTICRLPAAAAIPDWALASDDFLSITRTGDELSLVCPARLVPATAKQESGWRMLKVAGPLDFSLTGVLLAVLEPLDRAGVSVFAVSTFDTDYVLVKADRVDEATEALRAGGHSVSLPS
jgi:hypothetical protein